MDQMLASIREAIHEEVAHQAVGLHAAGRSVSAERPPSAADDVSPPESQAESAADEHVRREEYPAPDFLRPLGEENAGEDDDALWDEAPVLPPQETDSESPSRHRTPPRPVTMRPRTISAILGGRLATGEAMARLGHDYEQPQALAGAVDPHGDPHDDSPAGPSAGEAGHPSGPGDGGGGGQAEDDGGSWWPDEDLHFQDVPDADEAGMEAAQWSAGALPPHDEDDLADGGDSGLHDNEMHDEHEAGDAAHEAPHGAASSARPLVSPQAADSAARAFAILRRNRSGAAPAVNGLDAAAIEEMLRPMLRQWLDANLPDIVERLVREEIRRIAHEGTGEGE